MIGPNAYNTSFYNAAAMPRVAGAQAATADAADFSRILNETAPQKSNIPAPAEAESHPFLSFLKDVFDVINPLQHIPVIGAIYRHITGDEISPMAHLAGDALYGGPIGGALALADIAYQKTTGKDVGETVIAALTAGKNPADAVIARASDIIWDAPPTTISRLSPTPALPAPTGTGEKGPAPHSTPTQAPVDEEKANVITALQPQTASKVDSTIALHRQEAPAGASRTDAPPELIAVKMMDALDKYRQMKQGRMAPVVSGMY